MSVFWGVKQSCLIVATFVSMHIYIYIYTCVCNIYFYSTCTILFQFCIAALRMVKFHVSTHSKKVKSQPSFQSGRDPVIRNAHYPQVLCWQREPELLHFTMFWIPMHIILLMSHEIICNKAASNAWIVPFLWLDGGESIVLLKAPAVGGRYSPLLSDLGKHPKIDRHCLIWFVYVCFSINIHVTYMVHLLRYLSMFYSNWQ